MTRLSRSESQARTRERLLEAARAAFIGEGYARTSLEAIADRAGYSKGAVYSNFESKESLFLELLEAKLDIETRAVGALIGVHQGAAELLRALRRYLETHEDVLDFTVTAVEFMTQLAHGSQAANQCAALYAAQRSALEALIRRLFLAAEAGEPSYASEAAAGAVALTLGLATQRSLDRKAISAALWARITCKYLETMLRPSSL
jgi:AcrR family transcriptional regulator